VSLTEEHISTILGLVVLIAVAEQVAGHERSYGDTITIDGKARYQEFDGMGFSEAFQRCTQIYGADGLSEANTERVLDLLFSNENGAGLTIFRYSILSH
jgi:O-glycosyl hydrolase